MELSRGIARENSKPLERVLRSRTLASEASSNNNQNVKPKTLPPIQYEGNIKYLTDTFDIASTCEELINWVEAQTHFPVPVAFDMEWPFNFKTGSGKTAVMQLCLLEDTCYVFQIVDIKRMPAAVTVLLSHEKVRLHGVNIRNDIQKLQRDYPEIPKARIQAMLTQCVDLSSWCNKICDTGNRWSLERLCAYICKLQIDKNRKVRMSHWNVKPLSDAQQLYAAIDVYIGQVIYRKLDEMRLQKEQKIAELTDLHGEDSLRILKSLDYDFLSKDNL